VQVCELRELVVANRGASFPLVVVGNKADLGPQIHKEVFQVKTVHTLGLQCRYYTYVQYCISADAIWEEKKGTRKREECLRKYKKLKR
jgi:hypothetical protein